jgi:uncharacterized protein
MSLSLKDQLIAAGLIKPDANKPLAERPSSARPNAARPNAPNAHRTHSHASAPNRFDAANKPNPQQRVIAVKSPAAAAKPSEPSLAELYRAREQQTQKEQQEAKRHAEQKAKEKRERKLKVTALVAGAALNIKDAEYARHFEYARKIRRIYLSPEQRELLNSGALGIVQMDGQFLLLPNAIVESVHHIAPEFVALMGANVEAAVAPAEATVDPNYADPKFQIPDDLTW